MGQRFAYDETNILSIVDRAVLTTKHMYLDNGIDPEGLLSTLPAIAHTLLGFLIGGLLFRKSDANVEHLDTPTHITLTKVVPLFVVGTSLLFVGYLLSYGCPINKKSVVAHLCTGNLWTSFHALSLAHLGYRC